MRLCATPKILGEWESRAIRLLREQETAGSNPASPTKKAKSLSFTLLTTQK
jgi:hypothetical protein